MELLQKTLFSMSAFLSLFKCITGMQFHSEPKKILEFLELELQTVVSYRVGPPQE